MAKKFSKKEFKYIIGIILFALIICLIALAVYAGVNLVINPTAINIVKKGNVSKEESESGYVIRKETIIEGDNCYTIKNQGEKVATGEDIFRYYTADEEQINEQIEQLNKQIQESLKGQMNLFQNDVRVLETQIENRIDGLNNKNNVQEISEYKSDINGYMSKISKIAGENSQAGSYISNLIAQRTELENKLNGSSKYIATTTSGVLSYRIDGFETEITVDKIPILTSSYLEGLDLKKGQIAATSTGRCKIIDNYECYIAVVSDSKEAMSARNRNRSYFKVINSGRGKSKFICKK